MEPATARPWYKKKRYLIPAGLIALGALGSIGSAAPASSATQQMAAPIEAAPLVAQPAQAPIAPQAAAPTAVQASAPAAVKSAPSPALLNDSYYTNVDGNQIHSPAHAASVPAGASAQCRDGSYSFSAHRSGTCSHHGGVATWL